MDNQTPQGAADLVRTLARSFPVRHAVDPKPLRELFEKKAYAELVGSIKRLMHLDMRLTLATVRSGGRSQAAAWIAMPLTMPSYGTDAFRTMSITVYIYKEFLEGSSFETVVIAIAHELAHIVLAAIGHPLRWEERAVDVTAMMLGFAEHYERGSIRQKIRYVEAPSGGKRTWYERLFHRLSPPKPIREETTMRLGYLDRDEIAEAATEIRRFRVK